MPLVGKRKAAVIAVLFSLFLLGSMSGMVFASSENWVEVVRFTGGSHEREYKTESFTCDHVDWRIRWAYEPRTDIPVTQSGIEYYVYRQEYPDHWFSFMAHYGEFETNGTEYINDRNGTFYLGIISDVQNYTLIIEQNLDSIPEFPSWTILPLFLTVTMVVAIYKRKLSKTSNSSFILGD